MGQRAARYRDIEFDSTVVEDAGWQGKRRPGQRFTRHGGTRFVASAPALEPPRPPEIGDAWEPLTVRVRLYRLAEVFRRIPHTPDTKPGSYRSCMPDIVRERWKDAAVGTPVRIPVSRLDLNAAYQVLDDIVRWSREQRLLGWGIACAVKTEDMTRELRCSERTLRTLKLEFLRDMAEQWNRLDWRPDHDDVARARRLIHRNRK